MPAKAGIQKGRKTLDARLRGHDGISARYVLDGLPNKVLAAEYQTVLPPEKLLAEELAKTRRELEARGLGNVGNRE